MQDNELVYKEGDLVKVRTNKCNVHLMEMFGGSEFHPDDISASEYIGLITSVIGDGECYAVTIFVPHGECYHVIDNAEILGLSSIDDLPEDKREKANWKNPIERITYTDAGHDMLPLDVKRLSLAIAAVKQFHPEGTTRVVEMPPGQSFQRAAIYKSLDDVLAQASPSENRRQSLEEKKNRLVQWADSLRFEEHYEYHIGIDTSNAEVYDNTHPLDYYIVAVNGESTKAFVMRTRDDQALFFNYLGPDFKSLYIEADIFHDECKEH